MGQFALLITVLMLAGCAQYDPARAVFEGVKNHNEALKTPTERAMSTPPPSYDAYRKEREQKSSDRP